MSIIKVITQHNKFHEIGDPSFSINEDKFSQEISLENKIQFRFLCYSLLEDIYSMKVTHQTRNQRDKEAENFNHSIASSIIEAACNKIFGKYTSITTTELLQVIKNVVIENKINIDFINF